MGMNRRKPKPVEERAWNRASQLHPVEQLHARLTKYAHTARPKILWVMGHTLGTYP